ncbi:MAG: B12-binding domain-containing radical SAM protein [Acetobacteraceae bacterium]|nr:B12-binding domain-containing radical SAM protein [Acetobacteraceae bacterium]
MRRCRTVLVNPRVESSIYALATAVTEHLGLSYVAAVLRHAGHPVLVVDLDAERSLSNPIDAIRGFAPDLVGLTSTFLTMAQALRLARALKARLPGVFILMGGHHATFTWQRLLAGEPQVDGVAIGEGEETALDLADALAGRRPIQGIPGLALRGPHGPEVQVLRPPPDVDALPWPVRDGVARRLAEGKVVAVSVLASRGCFGRCTFCSTSAFSGSRWRPRSPASVAAEIAAVAKAYPQARFLHLADDEFLGPGRAGKEHALEIARCLIDLGLTLDIEFDCRVDSFLRLSPDEIGLLRQAGVSSVYMGLESGQQDMLDLYAKGTSVEQNRAALRAAAEAGLSTSLCGCIPFNPYADVHSLRETAGFLLEVGQASLVNLTQRLQLLPGTGLEQKIRSDGLLLSDNYRGPYLYRYRDPVVGTLAKWLDVADHPLAVAENSIVPYVSHQVRRLARSVGMPLEWPPAQATLNACADIQQRNHSFFMDALQIAARGGDPSEYRTLAAAYWKDLEQGLDLVQRLFHTFALQVEDRLFA